MAYIAFFSLFPVLAVGFTVFGLVVGNDADQQARVIDSVNNAIGTTIITPLHGTGGIVTIDQLTGSSELTIAGILGLLGSLLAGLGWLDAMREGIRAMFAQPPLDGNIVRTKLRDLLVLATIGVVLLASAVAGVAASGATGQVLKWIGLQENSVPGRLLIGAVSTLLLLGVDILVFMVIFRLLSGVQVPANTFADAALVGGIGLGVLKLFAGLLLNIADNNKFLATAGVLLGLLVWLNLVSRLTLVAAALAATMAIDRGHLADPAQGSAVPAMLPQRSAAGSGGGSAAIAPQRSVARSGARIGAGSGAWNGAGSDARNGAGSDVRSDGGPARAVPFTPVVSPRSADRVSVAAGAVLGAAGLFAVRTALGAVRAVAESARRSPSDQSSQ